MRHTPLGGPKDEFVVRHLTIQKGTGAKMRRAIGSGIVSGTCRSAIGQFFNPEIVAIVNSTQSPSRFQRLVFIKKDQWTLLIISKGINQVHKTFQKNRNRLISMKYSPPPPPPPLKVEKGGTQSKIQEFKCLSAQINKEQI